MTPRLMKNGALTAQTIEQLGYFQPIDFVDGDVAHRLQQALRPDGARHGPDAAVTSVERQLQPVHQPRRPLGQDPGALDDQSPR